MVRDFEGVEDVFFKPYLKKNAKDWLENICPRKPKKLGKSIMRTWRNW